MRIGIITDAHANLPALEAVLRVFRDERCDLIVHTGDAVGVGPHPREVVETLVALPNAQLLMGNHDEYAVQGPAHSHMANMDPEERSHHAWVRDQLDDDLIDEMAHWPLSFEMLGSGTLVRFCHYARTADSSNFAPILRNAAPSDYDRLFQQEDMRERIWSQYDKPQPEYIRRFGSTPALVFHGHDHPRSVVHGESTYVIPGALGVWHFPLASYAILTLSDEEIPDLRLDAVPYDGASVLRDLELRQVPARDLLLEFYYGLPG